MDTAPPARIWDAYLTENDRKFFATRPWGRQGFGKRPALLVIDVSYAFAGDRPEPIMEAVKKWGTSCGEVAWKAIPVIRRLIDLCRSKGMPVIYTTGGWRADYWDYGSWGFKHRAKDLKEETRERPKLDGNEIVPELAPKPEDIVIRKLKPSAFHGTPLQSYLDLLDCDSVIITGTTTSGCVRATACDAFANNLRATVVEDACFDRAEAPHAINLLDMDMRYADVIGSGEVAKFLEAYPAGQFQLPTGKGVVGY